MTAYSVFLMGITVAVHGHDDGSHRSSGEDDGDLAGGWRYRFTVTLAIVLWLLTWLGGWWIGRTLSSGSFVMTVLGACCGWCVGLGVATLVFYLDERL